MAWAAVGGLTIETPIRNPQTGRTLPGTGLPTDQSEHVVVDGLMATLWRRLLPRHAHQLPPAPYQQAQTAIKSIANLSPIPLAPIHAPLPPAELTLGSLSHPGNSLLLIRQSRHLQRPVELCHWFGTVGGSPLQQTDCAAAIHENEKESHHEADAHQRHAARRTPPGHRRRTKAPRLRNRNRRARTAQGNIYKAVVTRVEPSLEACFWTTAKTATASPFKEISRSTSPRRLAQPGAHQRSHQRRPGTAGPGRKEERGNKGAALTTFISLAGRCVVLMPNNPVAAAARRRRIEGEDRAEAQKRRWISWSTPNGMSIIARTAGTGRSAPNLQWDPELPAEMAERHRRRRQGRQGRLPDLPGIEPGDPRDPRLLQQRHR